MITPINNFNNLFEDWNKKNKTTYNPMDAGLGFLYGADALLSYNQELRDTTNRENMMRDRFRDNSIYDYNQMYGRNTNGGSQYQPIIMAEEGAIVRTETSKLDPINVESGEVLLLPDGNLEVIKGKKHSKGGVNTVLPQGAVVFSNKLKPENADKTFAELAKESDYTREKKVLENPYSSDAERKSAELMFNRKKNLLMELLEEQQYLNNDSSGEPMMKKGGKVMYSKGGVFPPGDPPYSDIVKKNESIGKNALSEKKGSENWQKTFYDSLAQYMKTKKGVNIPPFQKHIDYQKQLIDVAKPELIKLLKDSKMPLTNKHREILGVSKDISVFSELSPEKQKELTDDKLIEGYQDELAGHRGILFKPGKLDPEKAKQYKYASDNFYSDAGDEKLVDEKEMFNLYYPQNRSNTIPNNNNTVKQPVMFPQGNQYNLNNTNEKPGYNKRNLPFYQAAPEMLGFLSSMNTYNYWTPDYNHWEIAPPTLNIQSNLESIDSSMNAINATTTGDPRIDNNRKSANYIQALNQKQQAFQNKQNYDAEGRFRADQFNIGERLKERDNDIKAASLVYNEYMPLAKDYATGERLNAISSLVEKVGMNKQNENLKKLYLDNFYENVFMDDEGNMKINSRGNFNENYYPSSSDKSKKEKLFEPIAPLDIYDEVTPIKKDKLV